jgi:hypothetical protein
MKNIKNIYQKFKKFKSRWINKMKTTLFFSILIIALLTGCSDNPMGTDMISQQNIGDNQPNQHLSNLQNELNTKPNLILLWSHPGLNIVAKGERCVYDEVNYLSNFNGNNNILVTYDGWATPDTSCYISSVFITLNGINLHIDIGAQYINGHHEYALGSISGERLRFAVMLWHDEFQCSSYAVLKISDLKIYSY